jgi:hypothetical protein
MNYWLFLPFGYLFSILIETPILVIGLSPRHPMSRRLFAGVWLTACTYPIVCLVLPAVFEPYPDLPGGWRLWYLLVAETFAPVAECTLFALAFWTQPENVASEASGGDNPEQVTQSCWRNSAFWRDMITIVLANLASFGLGEVAQYFLLKQDWFQQFFYGIPPELPG